MGFLKLVFFFYILFFCLYSSAVEIQFGGEVRQRATYLGSRDYGEFKEDGDDSSELIHSHRYELNSFLKNGPYEFDLEVNSAIAGGGLDDNSPLERNTLFLGEAQFRYKKQAYELNVGRFSYGVGSTRLIAKRLGPNVKRRFDGVFYRGEYSFGLLDIIFLNEVLTRTGGFDDKFSPNKRVFGLYLKNIQRSYFDIYYLGSVFNRRSFNSYTGKDKRHSFGLRYHKEGTLKIDSEVIAQIGSLKNSSKDNSVFAFTVANNIRWQYSGLKFNYASGDSNPNDAKIGTFNPLFPRGNYFDEVALVGPQNFFNFSPYGVLEISESFSVEFNLDFFYRAQTEDHIYNPGGIVLREANGSRALHVHNGVNAVFSQKLLRGVTGELVLSHIRPGRFIKETGSSDNINFIELTLNWRLI